MASIASEYTKEVDRANGLGVCRLSDHVRQLLDGSRADIGDFAYGIDGWHIGLVARGGGAAAVMRRLAALLGRDLLEVSVANATAWAWLGGQRRLDFAEIERSVSTSALEGLSIAVGEPGMGLPGWRTTHDQARAALALALHRPGTLTRYADDPLLASALRDVTVRVSLRQIFVEPLSHERDGGTVSRSTLRAYLAAGRNASTAAHVLGVNRHTVERRLRRIEERLGRPIQSCAPELELALRLEALPNEAVPQS